MSNLENNIKDCIQKELEKGIIEKVISEKLEDCISDALKEMFGYRGELRKVLEDKIKSVMIPYLEEYNYSNYIVKLDVILTEILKETTLDNKDILNNFKNLTIPPEQKIFKMSEIFEKWVEYCKENIDTINLDFDCGTAYINVNMYVEDVSSSWSDFKNYIVTLECDEDEKLKFEFSISCWPEYDGEMCSSTYKSFININSLRNMNEFEMFILKISQSRENIELDITQDSEEIEIEEY